MASRFRVLLPAVLAATTALTLGCGGGTKVGSAPVPDKIEVLVSAGSPVAGALVAVFAINDATGQVNVDVGAAGVLGSAGPTDASGRVTVTTRRYSGPVQIVASGPALTYTDPTLPPDASGAAPVIQVPSAFSLSSYVPSFKDGSPFVVPVTLYTTLADHAALAYARGLHSGHPAKTTISDALAARDQLFVTHVTRAEAAWDPGTLRTTAPAALTMGAQSLVDGAFAALFDVALNQLAKDTAVRAGYGSGAAGLTAPVLLQLLEDDLDADGRLDGVGQAGRVIRTAGGAPVALDTDFLRLPLAAALLTWARDGRVNKSGIRDADLAGALVFKSLTEDVSDLFGSAPTHPFDPLDRLPPTVELAVPAPSYTQNGSIELSIVATDGSGVNGVFAQVGARKVAGELRDGTWHVATGPLNVGHNSIAVWAEDAAPTPNSGLASDPPYQLAIDLVYDPEPPTATYDSTFASYADEREMAVRRGPDGLALVPAVYSVGPRTSIAVGGDIYKAATRIEVGHPPDAAELEGPNLTNTPVLRFFVPFNVNTDAPITAAEYLADLTCDGCGSVPTAVGALLPSPSAVAQGLYFDLPLSVETVPGIAQVTGPAALTVGLRLADAAGNAATIGVFGFTFHAVGPPVAVAADGAFAGYGDPKSTYPYRIAGHIPGVNTYATLFDTNSAAFFAGQVRLLRYVVSNPSPKPIAVRASYSQASGGSWRVSEVWRRQSWVDWPPQWPRNGPASAFQRLLDGFVFMQALYWATPYGSQGARLANTETGVHPCGGPGMGTPAHRMGDFANRWTCLPDSVWVTPTTEVFATSVVTPVLFAGPQQGGGEVIPPASDGSGTALVIPGAVGAAPGTLVLYLIRPLAAVRTRPLQLNLIGNMDLYETWDYEAALFDETWASGSSLYDVYSLFKTGEYLESASETIEGGLSVSTQGLTGTALFGEPATAFSESYAHALATH